MRPANSCAAFSGRGWGIADRAYYRRSHSSGHIALLPLPLGAALALLPIIGVALNGTSSVLYGTVPDLVPAERRESAFGVFYTGTIGAGALSPALYGLLSDAIGLTPAMLLVARLFC